MGLSYDIISEFVKVTNGNKEKPKEGIVYATIVQASDGKYVKIDGSDLLTPTDTTTDIEDGERVTVMIKDHRATVTGNVTAPSASGNRVDKVVETVTEQIGVFETVVADKVSVNELEAYKATIENLIVGKADIEDLEATNAVIENLKVKDAEIENAIIDKADIEDLEAVNAVIENLKVKDAEIENLVADKATINDLNAVNADIQNLKVKHAQIEDLVADKADIEDLEAVNAVIEDLKVKDAEIENLVADKATIEDLEATKAEIEVLDADFAEIKTLVSGNLTSDNILSFNITADKVTMEDAFIKDAMIDTVNAAKINAGRINTNSVVIGSEDGGMRISGATQQFTDKNGNVRIQIGRDASNDFTFALYGEDGQGQIINQNGITASAIADGLIVNDMVSDNAAISGGKLDISSVVTEINNDNTTTIKSNKIYLDEQNQSLEVAFKSLKTQVDTIKDIDSDLTTITDKIQSNTSKIEANKSSISTLLAEDTAIKKQVTDLEGNVVETTNTLTSKYTSLQQNLDGFKTTVNNTYATKTSVNDVKNNLSSNYSTTSAMNSAINQKVDEITASVSSTYATKNEVKTIDNNIKANYSTTEQMSSAISVAKDEINLGISKVYETKTEVNNKVSNAVNNIKIGGRNLAQLTSSSFSTPYTKFTGGTNISPTVSKVLTDGLNVGDTVYVKMIYKYTDIVAASGQTAKCNLQGEGNVTGWSPGAFYGSSKINISGSGEYTFLYSFTVTADHLKNTYWQLSVRHDYVQSGSVQWKMLKVEKGTKATDWTPAPEDVDTSIDNAITTSKNYTDSQIKISKDAIELGVSQTYETKSSVSSQISSTLTSAKSYADTKKSEAISTASSDATSKANNALTSAKSYADTKKSEAITSANNTLNTTIANYYTKTQTDSQIKIAKDAINLGISQTYETKTNVTSKVNSAISTASSDATTKANNALTSAKSYADTKKTEAINSANSTLNTTIANYYTKTQTDSQIKVAKDAIDLSVKSLETEITKVEELVDSTQIGGRNLVSQSKLISNVNKGAWSVSDTGNEGFKKLEIVTTSTEWLECQIPVYPYINTLTSKLTISFEYYESNAGILAFSFGAYNGSTRVKEITNVVVSTGFKLLASEPWKRVSYTFDPTSVNEIASATRYQIQFKKQTGKTGTVYVRKPKLEIGTVATDWSPAPEDVTTDITQAKNDAITSANNTLNTTIANYYTKTQTDSQIKIAKDAITSSVSSTYETKTNVQNKIDGIQVGGRNLAIGSKTATNDFASGGGTVTTASDLFGGITAVKTNTAWSGRYFNLKAIAQRGGFKVGDKLVLSVYIKSDQNVTLNVTAHRTMGTGNTAGSSKAYNNFTVTPTWKQVWFPFVADAGTLDRVDARIEVNTATNTNYIYWAGWKLEKGTVGTDWSPAPEDVDNTISSLSTRVSTAEQKITSDAIVSTVTSSATYKNNLTGKVDKTTIISSINQTAESVKINASKIELTGAVVVNAINSGSTTINGSKITTGTISANSITSGTFKGTNFEAGGSSNGNGYIKVQDASNNILFQANKDGIYSKSIEFALAPNYNIFTDGVYRVGSNGLHGETYNDDGTLSSWWRYVDVDIDKIRIHKTGEYETNTGEVKIQPHQIDIHQGTGATTQRTLISRGSITMTGNGKNLVMGTGGTDVYIHNNKSGKYIQLKDDGRLTYSDYNILRDNYIWVRYGSVIQGANSSGTNRNIAKIASHGGIDLGDVGANVAFCSANAPTWWNGSTSYKVYTSGSKPTPADIGAAKALVSANGYQGMTLNDGSTSNWIRTTTNGLLPSASSGSSWPSSSSSLGTSSWRFSKGYVKEMYVNGLTNDLGDIWLTAKTGANTIYAQAKWLCPATSATTYLGSSGYRWHSVWAANGTIQTSDERFKVKQGFTNIDDCFEMIKNTDIYNYIMLNKSKEKLSKNRLGKMAMENSKNDVNIHIGIMAQDIQKYECSKGILIESEYEKEDGTTDTLLGINAYGLATAVMGGLKKEIQIRNEQYECLKRENEELKTRLANIERMLTRTLD
jgi:hypothetical protein